MKIISYTVTTQRLCMGNNFMQHRVLKESWELLKKNFKTEEPTQIPKISAGRDVQSLIDKSV